jgi:two-component system LytT family response regulator
MLRTIIIEDEENVKISIEKKLEQFCPEVNIIGWANNVKNAVNLIVETKPDLVLLDIKLPDGTGFDILKILQPINFKLIFLTAYNEYATEAFRFSAIDYLVKPVQVEELKQAIAKASQTINLQSIESRLDTLFNNINNLSKKEKRLVLHTTESIRVVELSEIIRLEADINYTRFYLTDGKEILVSKTLKEYVEMLCSYNFFRSHKSHLINMDYFKSFEKADGGYILLKNNQQVPLSIRNKDNMLELLKKM